MISLKNRWLVNDANQTIQIVLVAASTALFFFLLGKQSPRYRQFRLIGSQ